MKPLVTIVDYGSGNLLSVARAFEHCGAEVLLSHDPDVIEQAGLLVLPGVGAFGDGMRNLEERALSAPLRRHAAAGRPLLGICLGMQMLASASSEFGATAGLGIIPGQVVPVPAIDSAGRPQKIPHIGWAELQAPQEGRWEGTMFEGTPAGSSVYLVHSYHFVPDAPAHRLALCDFGGHPLVAAVSAGNTVGCQFHPEKSGRAGLALLAQFLRMEGRGR